MTTHLPRSSCRTPAARSLLMLLAAGGVVVASACSALPPPSGGAEPAPGQTGSGSANDGASALSTSGDDTTGSGPSTGAADSAAPTEVGSPTAPTETPSDVSRLVASVESSLRALAASNDAVTREQVRDALELGFAEAQVVPESVEVSIDETPTGLDVDAIQGAGLTAGQCVFGEVREGEVSVAVLPVLDAGACFVGDQR